MHKLLPEIKVDYRKFSITAMKEMLSSGIWNSFNQASNILLTSLDNARILAHFRIPALT